MVHSPFSGFDFAGMAVIAFFSPVLVVLSVAVLLFAVTASSSGILLSLVVVHLGTHFRDNRVLQAVAGLVALMWKRIVSGGEKCEFGEKLSYLRAYLLLGP